jgi:hypothetical protein
MVLIVVQPENHGRIFRQVDQKLSVVAHALVAEQFDLLQELVIVIDFRITGREHMMPEQRHLLFQRALGVDQVEHPVDVPHGGLATGQQSGRLVAHQRVSVNRGLRLGMQQLFHCRFIPFRHTCFELVAARSEACPPHQVSHESYFVLVCHAQVSLFWLRVTLPYHDHPSTTSTHQHRR